MPELPEVETIRRHLAPHVEQRTLRRLEVLDERWSRPLAPQELAAAVLDACRSWSGGDLADDCAVVVLRRTG